LATPVLGGMVSSLLHVLVVTPVIFTWLRERELFSSARRDLKNGPSLDAGADVPSSAPIGDYAGR
jgi:copper/silver efflux system protein